MITIDPAKVWESQLLKHDRQLLGCRFSPCGTYVFAAAADYAVHRWNLESEAHTALNGHPSWVGGMAFYPDQQRLVTGDYVGTLHCWNYADETPTPVWSVKDAHPSAIRTISVSADGRYVATAGHDSIVRVWSADDGKLVHELKGHGSPVYAGAIHPDGNNLVTAEQHGIVCHWDLAAGKLVRKLDASLLWTDASLNGGAWSSGIRGLTFCDSGDSLACTGITELKDGDRRGGNASILMLDWKVGKRQQLLQAKSAGYAERVVFHPSGDAIAACLTQEFGSIQFWKRDAEQAVHKIKSNCRDIDLHPDGTRIAVAEWEKFGKVGNNPSTKEPVEFSPHHGVIRIHTLIPRPAEEKATS